MRTVLAWRPSESQRGTSVGVLFCLITLVNAVAATHKATALLTEGARADDQTTTVLYFVVGSAVLMHVLTWFVYSVLVATTARFVFAHRADAVRLATLFATAGTAQLPLVVWALLMALTWLAWPPTSPHDLLVLARLQLGTRTVAYFCALVVMTFAVAARYNGTKSAAIVAAWAPALVLWLLSIVVTAAIPASSLP